MKKLLLGGVGAALLGLLTIPNTSQAALTLTVDDGTTTKTFNTLGSTLTVVDYTLAGWILSVDTGVQGNGALLDTSSINVSSASGGYLKITLQGDGFTQVSTPTMMSIGGTFNVPGGATIAYSTLANGNPLGSLPAFSGTSGSFSGDALGGLTPGASPFTLSQVIEVWHTGNGTSSFDASLSAVPEPTTVLAGALLLLPLGASTLRIFRRKA